MNAHPKAFSAVVALALLVVAPAQAAPDAVQFGEKQKLGNGTVRTSPGAMTPAGTGRPRSRGRSAPVSPAC